MLFGVKQGGWLDTAIWLEQPLDTSNISCLAPSENSLERKERRKRALWPPCSVRCHGVAVSVATTEGSEWLTVREMKKTKTRYCCCMDGEEAISDKKHERESKSIVHKSAPSVSRTSRNNCPVDLRALLTPGHMTWGEFRESRKMNVKIPLQSTQAKPGVICSWSELFYRSYKMRWTFIIWWSTIFVLSTLHLFIYCLNTSFKKC